MQRVSEIETYPIRDRVTARAEAARVAHRAGAHAAASDAKAAYYAARPCRKAVFGGAPNRRRLSASYHATKGAR